MNEEAIKLYKMCWSCGIEFELDIRPAFGVSNSYVTTFDFCPYCKAKNDTFSRMEVSALLREKPKCPTCGDTKKIYGDPYGEPCPVCQPKEPKPDDTAEFGHLVNLVKDIRKEAAKNDPNWARIQSNAGDAWKIAEAMIKCITEEQKQIADLQRTLEQLREQKRSIISQLEQQIAELQRSQDTMGTSYKHPLDMD